VNDKEDDQIVKANETLYRNQQAILLVEKCCILAAIVAGMRAERESGRCEIVRDENPFEMAEGWWRESRPGRCKTPDRMVRSSDFGPIGWLSK
jgi:hypothetical protein